FRNVPAGPWPGCTSRIAAATNEGLKNERLKNARTRPLSITQLPPENARSSTPAPARIAPCARIQKEHRVSLHKSLATLRAVTIGLVMALMLVALPANSTSDPYRSFDDLMALC